MQIVRVSIIVMVRVMNVSKHAPYYAGEVIRRCVQILVKRLSTSRAHFCGTLAIILNHTYDPLQYAGNIVMQFDNFKPEFPGFFLNYQKHETKTFINSMFYGQERCLSTIIGLVSDTFVFRSDARGAINLCISSRLSSTHKRLSSLSIKSGKD